MTGAACTTQYAVGLPIVLQFDNSVTNTAVGVVYDPPLGLMPAAPLTIVATLNSPGFRVVSAAALARATSFRRVAMPTSTAR
jgi:hypothetical protein